MIPAISQACSLDSPFEKDLEEYAAGACRQVEVWLGKLERYLDRHTPQDVLQLCQDHGVQLPVASYQGGLLGPETPGRAEHLAHFARRLQLCRQLQIGTLVLACDLRGPLSQAILDQLHDQLRRAADLAAPCQVRLALEFQAQATLGNNLQTAAALVAEAAHPSLGLCLDLFHYQVGPSKPEDLRYLHAGNLFHVQVCDLAGQARELASDSDRILPGEGDIDLAPILAHLRQIGYGGLVSLELMNPQIWQVPARQLGEVGITSLRRLLGQARME